MCVALLLVLLLALSAGTAGQQVSGLGLLVTGDWGGQGTPPYVNDVERANANAMAGLLVDPLAGVTPSMGLLIGDNFYSRGIDCFGDPEEDCTSDSRSHRFAATFENVFSQPAFDDFPFYVILGNHDHYGNATAQLEYAQQNRGSGRWKMPAKAVDDLYYTLHESFLDPQGANITLDIFMLDTVQWAGLREQCYQHLNTTDEELQLLWSDPRTQPMKMSWAQAEAQCSDDGVVNSCCLLTHYWASVPLLNNVSSWGVEHASENNCGRQENTWPDRDHELVCGQCRVLVNHFTQQYNGKCSEYCASINRTCTGAWEEADDTCRVESVQRCDEPIGTTSDALCECGIAGTSPPPPPTPFPQCVDDDSFIVHQGWAPACFPYELSWCHSEATASACCATCTTITPWCAEHGVEEAEWSVRAELKVPILAPLNASCSDIVEAGNCEADLHDLFAGSGVNRPPPGSIAMNVACPVSCGKCPRGDGVHRPPSAAELYGREWTCHADGPPLPPLPTTPWTGKRHRMQFTCPDQDDRIMGAREKASTWSHAAAARRQREWLERELAQSEADWKVVSGHYPVWSVAEHGPIPQLVTELKPLLERYNVAMYLNGHDHNAQHLNDGSNVEYFVIGAGSPVDVSKAHAQDVPAGALKFYWARHEQERVACDADPACPFDSSIKDGSFAHVTFLSKDEAQVELITHHGEVVYSVTKPNPRYHPEQQYTAVDRTQAGVAQKRYVPFKDGSLGPQQRQDTAHSLGGDGGAGTAPMLWLGVAVIAAVVVGLCWKTGLYRQVAIKRTKVGVSTESGGIYEAEQSDAL